MHVDQRQVEVTRNSLTGSHARDEPRRNRTIATAHFEGSGARPDVERLDVPAVHRIE
jgi:hypothetical protein